MAIKRTPKPKKARGPKREATDLVSCASCGRRMRMGEFPYVMSSLLEPTDYACSKGCYDVWCAAHPPPKKLPTSTPAPRKAPARPLDPDEAGQPPIDWPNT